jgi:DNA-binding protein YbaB
MLDRLKQIYELKKQADQMKRELEAEVLEVDHGGVTVKVNAAQKILNLSYGEGTNADQIKDAVNKAMDEAQKVAAKKMQGMMGGLGGLQDLMKGG